MPLITERHDYDGFVQKANRLGLLETIELVEGTITSFDLRVEEERHANGTRDLRKKIDDNFEKLGGWIKISSGGIDWTTSLDDRLRIGVEVQVSGRSDLVAIDVMHLSKSLREGEIDLGVIIVPDDTLSKFLTDRTPNYATAIKHVDTWGDSLPIRVIAFRHNGTGPPLPKMRTNLGRL